MFPEKYRDNRNIGPFKYRFRLSIFQINYLIDDIDYRTAFANEREFDILQLKLRENWI
jgi:hypothetical protein